MEVNHKVRGCHTQDNVKVKFSLFHGKVMDAFFFAKMTDTYVKSYKNRLLLPDHDAQIFMCFNFDSTLSLLHVNARFVRNSQTVIMFFPMI